MDDFYNLGLLGSLHLDHFKYRGRGRPRKRDYSTISEMQAKLNKLTLDYLDWLNKT